jgi:hypothetical protein
MKYTYEIVTNGLGEEALKRTDSEGVISWIPMVAGNSDYEAYLNPKAALSTPMVTDETKTI